MSTLIYPSLLSCDFGNLREEIKNVESAGADGIHVDVMDNEFVPNLSFGAPIVNCIKGDVKTLLDCHLMVQNPDRLVEDFAKAGATYITVHKEACQHLQKTLRKIKDLGCKAGVAINPATDFNELEWVLDDMDLLLSMTVNPGFGGQSLIPAALDKTKDIISWLADRNKRSDIKVQIDGGVNTKTAPEATQIGVDIMVAGSAVFKTDDYAKAIAGLKK